MSAPIRLPKHSAWASQILVINALLRREITTRFGEYSLGFFWMLFEPLLSVIVIGLIIGTIAQRAVPEIPYAFFLLNGKMLLNLFSQSMSTGINSIGSNQGLLVYPTVKPLDTFIARFFYVLLTTVFSFVLFCVCGMWLGIHLSLASLDILGGAYLITWLLGCGTGLIFGVAAAYFKEVEKVAMIVRAPLMFISAVIFPLSALPLNLQEIFLYNPLVHTIELSRHALFPFYNTGEVNLLYPFAIAVIVLAFGLTLFHGNRDFLSRS